MNWNVPIPFIILVTFWGGVKGLLRLSGPMWRTDVRCGEVISRRIHRLREGITNCSHALGIKNMKERDAKIYCIVKCTAIQEKMLTAEGLLDWKMMEESVGREMPPDYFSRASALFKKCYDLAHDQLDPTEEHCRSYKPFSLCIIEATAYVCKEKREHTTLISVTD